MALLSIESVIEKLQGSVKVTTPIELLPLEAAAGRVLSRDYYSAIKVPPADNSAMDGFAVNSRDLRGDGQISLPISQRVVAGAVPQPLKPHTAARIFTGGQLPAGADCVVIQEDSQQFDEEVLLPAGISPGQHIRRAGQDIKEGQLVVSKGQRLQPAHLGLFASVGIPQVEVFAKVRVALLSTGSELVEPGEELGAGKIYNSNRYTLQGLLEPINCDIVWAQSVGDDRESTIQRLSEASEQADLIISCGGVSVGEEDHVKPAVNALGHLDLWKIAIKPGKPMAYGFVGDTPFFGLPGNPVSVFVTFLILVRPYLWAMQGARWPNPQARKLPADFNRKPNLTRQEYLRVQIQQDDAGNAILREYSSQDSSVLSSTAWANALAVVPQNMQVSKGDILETYTFDQLLN